VLGLVFCGILRSTYSLHGFRPLFERFCLFFFLQKILPSGYDYIVCQFESLDCDGVDEERFFAVLRIFLRNDGSSVDADADAASDGRASAATEAEHWLRQFEAVSWTNWRVDKTYPYARKKLVFKVVVCQVTTLHRDM